MIDRTDGHSQFDDLLEARTNYAVYGSKERLPSLPDGYTKTVTSKGVVIHPDSVDPAAVRTFARRGTLDVLDMVDADGRSLAPPVESARRGISTTAIDAINAIKSIKSSGDVSALLRQGLLFISEPRAWYRGMRDGLKSLSTGKYEQIVEGIENHPARTLAEESGLYLATLKGGEEAFPSRLVNEAPVIKQSANSFNATLDTMRLETFAKYADIFQSEGMTPEANPKAFSDLARRINSMSGRGDWGKYSKAADALNLPLFSPRLIKARLEILNPVEYAKMDPRVRSIALKQTAKVTAAILSTLMLARMAGAEVETDIESPDFGKIKFGDTRYDITGGHARYLRIALQLGKRLAAGDWGEAASLVLSESRKNLSPAASYGVNAAVGEDVTGREFDWTEDSLRLVTPLMLEDLYDAYQAEGLTGSLKALPAAAGVSVQTYDEKERLKGHRSPPEKPVNVKANEKIASDPELKTIADELHRLDDVVGRARRRKGEADDDYNSRLESQEPKIKEALYEFITSPEYQNLTDTERKQGIKCRVQEIRHADEESDFSSDKEDGDSEPETVGRRRYTRAEAIGLLMSAGLTAEQAEAELS